MQRWEALCEGVIQVIATVRQVGAVNGAITTLICCMFQTGWLCASNTRMCVLA